jgi:hypothetical protein
MSDSQSLMHATAPWEVQKGQTLDASAFLLHCNQVLDPVLNV